MVTFGDGVRGARLPSGVNNVRATYRQGLGREGNVDAEKLTQLMTRPLGLKSVSNPLAGRGRHRPRARRRRRGARMPLRHPDARARGIAARLRRFRAAPSPASPRRRPRCCSCAAGRRSRSPSPGQDGAALPPASPVWNNLLAALRDDGDPHVRGRLLSYQASTFRIGLKVKRDPAYERKTVLAAVEAALRAHYALRRAVARPAGAAVGRDRGRAGGAGVVAVDLDSPLRRQRAAAQIFAVAAGAPAGVADAGRGRRRAAGRAADAGSRPVRGSRRCHDQPRPPIACIALLPAVYRVRDEAAGRAAARADRR